MSAKGRLALVLQRLHSTLEPTEAPVETLPDRGRRLRRSPISLHADGPSLRLRAIGFLGGLPGGFPGTFGAYIGASDGAAVDRIAGFGAHGQVITAALARQGNATRL